MGFGKTFGISMGIYFLLNLIFLFIFAAVGGVGVTFGQFFALVGQDLGGFFTALFTMGGTQADVFNSALSYAVPNGLSIAANIVGILWVLVPGLVAGIITGKYFSNESSKSAFFGTMTAIFVLTILPLIIVLIPAWTIPMDTTIGQTIVPAMYYSRVMGVLIPWTTMRYIYVVLAGLFNGAFFGGWSAMSSNSF
ncbi:MAG: hypothetical protein ACTSWX_00575 [Promethearchaeota archaeon]